MKRQAPFLFLGLLGGILFTFSPGTVFVLFLVLLLSITLWRFTVLRDRRFVVALFLIGFLVRASLSIGLDGLSCVVEGQRPHLKGPVRDDDINIADRTRSYLGMGDSDYYSERGYVLAQLAKGTMRLPSTSHQGQYGWHGYLHVIAAFYTLFDFSPVAVKFLNCFIGALLGPLLFFIAQACFNPTIARWTGLSVSFFPSLILWSASNLKEPILSLLTALLLLWFIQIRQAKSWAFRVLYAVLFSMALWAHAMMRSAIYPVALAGCLAISIPFTAPRRKITRLLVLLLLLSGLFLARTQVRSFLAQSFWRHVGHVQTRGTVYRYLPEPFYNRAFLEEWKRSGHLDLPLVGGLGRSIFHYLTEPIPGRVNSLWLTLTYPQVVFWYFLLPFAFLGMGVSFRWNFQRSLFLLFILSAWTFLGALTSGNIGTVFRMRDMVTPYFLLFICVGIWVSLNGRRNLQSLSG